MINSEIPLCSLGVENDIATSYKEFRILTFLNETFRENTQKFVPALSILNSLAFGFQNITPYEETEGRLLLSDTLMLATLSDLVIGFATYQIIDRGGNKVIYQSRGIVPQCQSSGLGRQFTLLACRLHKPDIVAGRAQNPVSIWSTIRSGAFRKIYPFDTPYSESEEFRNVLAGITAAKGYLGKVDLTTGIQRGAFPMGKLGDYKIELKHKEVAKIERYLQEAGLNRENGDAIYFLGVVHNSR